MATLRGALVPDSQVCAVVAFDYIAPMGVDAAWAILLRTDTIAPMVIASQTATRPAQIGNVDAAQRLDYIVTNATCVGDRGVFAHPNAS